jgi:SAM-dependent methyltransferase
MDFNAYWSATRATLDQTFLHERTFATTEPLIVLAGTCAPCMRPTRFTASTANGERLEDGAALPEWREGLTCGCPDRLNARLRATLHFLQTVTQISPWTRLLEFGPKSNLHSRLAGICRRFSWCPRLEVYHGAYRLPLASESIDVVLASDVIQVMPPLDAVISEVRRVLAPGGQFVATVPFRLFAETTVSKLDHLPLTDGLLPTVHGHEVHEFGWDILDRLRAARFRRALAYAYRSEELGYYGIANMVFAADA